MMQDNSRLTYGRKLFDNDNLPCPICGAPGRQRLLAHMELEHGYRFRGLNATNERLVCPCGFVASSDNRYTDAVDAMYHHIIDGGMEHHTLCLLIRG